MYLLWHFRQWLVYLNQRKQECLNKRLNTWDEITQRPLQLVIDTPHFDKGLHKPITILCTSHIGHIRPLKRGQFLVKHPTHKWPISAGSLSFPFGPFPFAENPVKWLIDKAQPMVLTLEGEMGTRMPHLFLDIYSSFFRSTKCSSVAPPGNYFRRVGRLVYSQNSIDHVETHFHAIPGMFWTRLRKSGHAVVTITQDLNSQTVIGLQM